MHLYAMGLYKTSNKYVENYHKNEENWIVTKKEFHENHGTAALKRSM